MIIGFEKCDEWEYNNRKIKRYIKMKRPEYILFSVYRYLRQEYIAIDE